MKKRKLTIFLSLLALLLSGAVYAGNLDQTLAPTDPATAMFTVEDIYQRLLNGTTATKRVGPFAEPGAGPASTGHTLDDVYNLIGTRAFVPKTGQTTSYETGDDGAHQKGVSLPSPRFTDNSNGTVTDNLTGLIWLKNANCFGTRNWTDALFECNTLENGACGLTDGSTAGQWRLPNLREIQSLIDYEKVNPALPAVNPFTNVQLLNYYWLATTWAGDTANAWVVNLYDGSVAGHGGKLLGYYVWPVRGGQ